MNTIGVFEWLQRSFDEHPNAHIGVVVAIVSALLWVHIYLGFKRGYLTSKFGIRIYRKENPVEFRIQASLVLVVTVAFTLAAFFLLGAAAGWWRGLQWK